MEDTTLKKVKKLFINNQVYYYILIKRSVQSYSKLCPKCSTTISIYRLQIYSTDKN